MGATHFLIKTLPEVATEMALSVLVYRLTRVMNIIGTKPLIDRCDRGLSHTRPPDRVPLKAAFTRPRPEAGIGQNGCSCLSAVFGHAADAISVLVGEN
jgi:hypothetical protein